MRQVLFFDGEQLQLIDQLIPEIAPDEVLIQPILLGICSTDLELTRGYKDFRGILGHEFVGRVVAGDENWLGKRVVGEINIGCGNCDMCRHHIPSHCRHRQVLGIAGNYDGAFATQFRLPVSNLYEVSANVTDEQAVFAEPLAAACQILDQIHIPASAQVIVVGVGKLGILVAQVLKTTGAHITGVVRHQKQIDLLKQWNIEALTSIEIPLQQADIVVDCTGNSVGFAIALDLVRPRGTIVLKSTYAGLPQADLTRVAVNEIQVVGSRCGPFPAALRLLAEQRIHIEPLIEAEFELSEAPRAFAHAAESGVLKVLLKP